MHQVIVDKQVEYAAATSVAPRGQLLASKGLPGCPWVSFISLPGPRDSFGAPVVPEFH